MKERLENRLIFLLGAIAGAVIGYMVIEFVVRPMHKQIKDGAKPF